MNLGADLIERQGQEIIVIYTDIKLCREEVLKTSDINAGVRGSGMDVSEELPHVVMIASFKAQIREVVQIDFLFANLNAHRHCNVLEPVYESLPDILEVVIAKDKVDSAVQTVENLIPLLGSTETEVSEIEDDIIRSNYIVPVGDNGFVHLVNRLERPIAISQYVGMVEMGVGSEEQPVTVKLVVHCHFFLLWYFYYGISIMASRRKSACSP